jgi:sterol desaturase/sphingolipid hydroxylase (fatty acid hydroxylase superfamily)
MDATVVAVPVYFGTMGAEYLYLRRRAEQRGPSPADYERRDTITSLTMGVGSLLAPMVVPKLFGPITPGKGRFAKALVITAIGAAAVTTIADVLGRLDTSDPDSADPDALDRGPLDASLARRVAAIGGVAAVVAGGIAITSTWASRTTAGRMWDRRVVRDLGKGPAALAAAVLGWDFIYYWNHRFMHESRYMWAIHVVHHSSERYNLSTALRQPVADALGTFVPYSLLALLGIRPELIAQARGINLLYQYWIHTDTIADLGPLEEVVNSPSHHRVHHGSNRQYLDRNHGSILIVWDRLFGTFEREKDPVVYGLTTNIDTFDPARVIAHEHADMLRDVSRSRSWRERLSYVLRGPGWAYARHATRG